MKGRKRRGRFSIKIKDQEPVANSLLVRLIYLKVFLSPSTNPLDTQTPRNLKLRKDIFQATFKSLTHPML